MTFTIRPFERVFDVDGDQPFKASAVLDTDGLCVSFAGSDHRCPVVERGRDQWGEFARIEPGVWSVGFGFELTVEPEFSEDGPPGCRVALTRPVDEEARKQVHDVIHREGIDTGSTSLLVPPATAVALYFHESGMVTGYSRLSSSRPRQGEQLH
jgi:hypothetical protein